MTNRIIELNKNEIKNIYGGMIIVSKEVSELIERMLVLTTNLLFACAVFYVN